MTYTSQLQWVASLQAAIRNPFVDTLFTLLDFVDTFWFVLIVIGFVWYVIDRKIGIRLFYIFFLSFVINMLLKQAFGLPRPCQIMPELGIVCHSTPGFPSGAAQSAVLYAGILFIESKKTLYRFLGVVFALILCFSRLYLGVHFPIDILGGLVVGGLLLVLYKKGFPFFANRYRLFSFLLPFTVLLINPPKLLYLTGASMGIAAGLLAYDQKKRKPTKRYTIRLTEFVCALLGAFVFEYFGSRIPDIKPLFSFCGAFWFSFFGWWCIQKTKNSIS